MGAMFRSEEMALAQLFIQPEAAYQSISELGETGTVQFRDLNEEVSAFQRKFVGEVRRCDEMERKLRYIEAEVRKDDVPIPDVKELPKAPNPREIIDLEAHLEKTEGDIRELSESAVKLKSNYLELAEYKHVLEKTQSFFIEQEEANGMDTAHKSLIPEDNQGATSRGRLGFVAGVVNRERVPAFERMLWRISRGNVFLRQAEIEKALEDPATGNEIKKTVFVAFFQGEQLKSRITKVCAGFHASIYQCPSSSGERNETLQNVKTQIEDLNLVLNQTADHRNRVLVTVAKDLQNWSIMVRKMKAIYHTLNMFNMDVTKKCLIGECWVPVHDIPIVQKALQDGSSAGGSSIASFLNVIDTNEQPPTFNRTNKFTRGFQNLIDSYGVASYREVNPALYTIITFPFLFAIMFGDVGHGFILFLFGLYMVLYEKRHMGAKSSSEIWNIFFAGRYIIVLMGLFSIYTGIMYNDIFSRTMNIFGSSWRVNTNFSTLNESEEIQLNPTYDYTGTPYFFGVDPAWMLAKNKIIFLNSYKMKLSIIFGVFHMMFGVCMSVVNFAHFRKMENFFFMFLPQIIFLMLLFLWMVVMMFLKWILYDANYTTETQFGSSCAPSVLILFINMMLFKADDPEPGCKEFMFEGQDTLQMVFVIIAVLCIPVMLLGKPIYVMMKRNNKGKHVRGYEIMNGDVNQGIELQPETTLEEAKPTHSGHKEGGGHGGHNEDDEPIGDIFIHQAIHTIEYVLSTVSHTASYLRLWALSLAHAQLSEVLWNMVLQMGLAISTYVGGVVLFFIFGAWAVLTVAILVMMEGLSAFLHTLRLHWVEFMSKFYEGLGYPFQPFSFKLIMEEDSEPAD
nr:V-type proton ATPase 116 kDa subunit a isoform X1 [Onthophagus taurus]XP_022908776.1 V-type proton ATPase 116 kDa subunit a isoform X1 [Onthophagus taurus]XP_022908777.1 V-type proton ATPase 116 kDa subunit a isoform X1 [Onthophagus taurus]XP_022908778.1 V-type proton ATPase 116 kDa subunit a isoform X1 [Onthophagus taurus]